jgi:hypothetical protein
VKPTLVSIFRKTNFLMTLVMLLIGVANIVWAEKLEINQGFGWDGMTYAAWAKDFHRTVLVERVPNYYIKRILPSALVHYGSRLVTAPFLPEAKRDAILNENRNVVLRFDLYNLLLLLVAVWTWGLIADQLKIQDRGKWFGFCFLFLNYAVLKNNFYHSVLTDTSAFALGLLMFYFFLTRKPVGLWITIFLGGFTWPSIPYMGALLFVFPYQEAPAGELRPPVTPSSRKWPLLLTLAGCGLALMMFGYLKLNLAQLLHDMSRMLRVDLPFFYISMAAVVAFLFVGLKPALSDTRLFTPRSILGAIRWSRVGIIVLTFSLFQVLYHRLANGQELTGGWGSQWKLMEYIFLSALTEPFIFLVAHTLYYGPVVLLLVFYWKPFCQSIQEYGIGLRLFVILNFFLSIAPQSRYQINAIAVFVILLVRLLDRSFLEKQSFGFWILLSLLYSKVWYTFNTAPQLDDGTIGILLRFPLQHYFTNSGPWMAPQMYLIQGSCVLVTAILLYFVVIRRTAGDPLLPQPEPTSL